MSELIEGQRIVYRFHLTGTLYEAKVIEISPSRKLVKLDPTGWVSCKDLWIVEILEEKL
jgi:hypothetical protein